MAVVLHGSLCNYFFDCFIYAGRGVYSSGFKGWHFIYSYTEVMDFFYYYINGSCQGIVSVCAQQYRRNNITSGTKQAETKNSYAILCGSIGVFGTTILL